MREERREMRDVEVTEKQRKGAVVTALVLAALALGIYVTVMLKFFVYA
jgi:hypothetical protein